MAIIIFIFFSSRYLLTLWNTTFCYGNWQRRR